MQTQLSPEFKDSAAGKAAESILRSCVHCGFCNATCPTYQVLGDELDGPRGRIYLIKELLEGGSAGRSTQLHLDRCLTCLNCETTCPSGVEYGKLVSIGRRLVDARVERPAAERALRWLLREGLTSRWFGVLLAVGRIFRGAVPRSLRHHLPPSGNAQTLRRPTVARARKVLLLEGCVQPALRPNINAATARVLDAAGIEVLSAKGAGCCGALREHLGDDLGQRRDVQRNIDAWWPLVAAGTVEAVVMNASACGLAVKHYGEMLRDDPVYRDKAARISALARDVSELLPDLVVALEGRLRAPVGPVMFHPPCTLQHGQRLRGGIEGQLARLGFDVRLAGSDSHLCCGSAGTYSVLQPALSMTLRDRKLAALTAAVSGRVSTPACIISANIGCIQHLQSGTAIPVRHWIELIDDSLPPFFTHL